MSFDALVKKYGIKAIYKVIKGDKIVLGVITESEDVNLQDVANYYGADEAIVIKPEDPKTRYPILSGTLLLSVDEEYRKNVEIEIFEKNAEMKLKNLSDDVISDLI